MKTYLECLPCIVRQALEAARHATEDETIHEEVLRRAVRAAADADLSKPTPVLIGLVHRAVRELTGNPDPYRSAKDLLNETAAKLYPRLREKIENAPDSLETALRFAGAGNVIDFVVSATVGPSEIDRAMADALSAPLRSGATSEFRDAVEAAERILYLGDNAGEILFDKLLIERLPLHKITFVVKGSPVVNDVTLRDAQSVNMSAMVEVIDNGSDLPGTVLSYCSESFLARFEDADLVISKGQGNYESLTEEDKDIFFIFKAKCEVMTLHLGCEIGTTVLLKKRQRIR